ncbi:aquaporin AQPcic-like [Lycorma delicatula]|uniref:aquaporin AQPcic-like n=1 Tax=Lycorma delicatula TaxID=130591 RepID=UPI003F5144FE
MSLDCSKERFIGLPPLKTLIAACLAELIGTLFLEFLGCLSLQKGFTLLQVAIAWGFIVNSIVQCFGHISGGQFNPSVTTACMVLGSVSVVQGILYLICQFIGGFIGFVLFKVIRDFEVHDDRTLAHRDSFSVKAGLLIACVVVAIGPLTGASLNFARSLPPAVINQVYDSFWAYVFGPILAGVVTPIIYAALLREPAKEGVPQEAINSVMSKYKYILVKLKSKT